jgi:hypothetical protein
VIQSLELVGKRSLAREVNQRIHAVNASFGQVPPTFEVLCECERGDCLERFEVLSSAYEEIRLEVDRFVVAAGHEGAERVVSGEGAYLVVALEPVAAYAS